MDPFSLEPMNFLIKPKVKGETMEKELFNRRVSESGSFDLAYSQAGADEWGFRFSCMD